MIKNIDFISEVTDKMSAVKENDLYWFSKSSPEEIWNDMKDCSDITEHPEFNEKIGLLTVKDIKNIISKYTAAGDLDYPYPNYHDPSKRGFDPR